MSEDNIARLYKNFAILEDSKDDISKHADEYKEILNAVKGGEKEKRLAQQFIPRFLGSFPDLAEEALEAQFDLCEDTDISIRKQAIRDLPQFTKVNKKFSYRISDALAQLFQAADLSELLVVQNTLLTLLKHDSKGALLGLFNQIKNGDDGIREKGLKFVYTKVMNLVKHMGHSETENLFICELKKVYQDSSADEIPVILDMLLATKLGSTTNGHKEIVEFVFEQLNNERPFTTTDEDLIERLTVSVKHILPLFSRQVNSNNFVEFLCSEVLPKLSLMNGFEEGADNVLEVLKIFAECSSHCTSIPCFEKALTSVYDLLIELMPVPDVSGNCTQEPRLQFSYVECLLFSLHRLAQMNTEFLNDSARLKKFRTRLQYFARALQGYIKTLHESLKGKTDSELRLEENKIKAVALKTTSNINTLIKDFFHTPPSYKSTILLSWISPTKDLLVLNSKKRPTPISFEENSPPVRATKVLKNTERELYQPPSGKYSSNITPPTEQGTRSWNKSRVRVMNFRGSGKMRRTWKQNF